MEGLTSIRSTPTFTRGKKRNLRLICFGLWLACKSLTKEQLKCLFSCSVAQKKEEAPVKQRVQGWCYCGSISQSQSSGMKLYCQWLFTYDPAVQQKDAKITVTVRTFVPPKVSFWVLGVSFVLNPLCLQGSLYLHLLWIPPFLSEYNNEGKIPSLLLSKVIMENCRNSSGVVRCLQCLEKIITQNMNKG